MNNKRKYEKPILKKHGDIKVITKKGDVNDDGFTNTSI